MIATEIKKIDDLEFSEVYLASSGIDDKSIVKEDLKIALKYADDNLLNLIHVGWYEKLPLCKFKDLSKERYYKNKSIKNTRVVSQKKILISPNIDNFDLQRKVELIYKALEKKLSVNIQKQFKRGFRKKMNKEIDIEQRLLEYGIILKSTGKNLFKAELVINNEKDKK